ncbi:NAD(P)/FAD-dependent oxidoreductase [Magnetococcales bacterium HHB-1]
MKSIILGNGILAMSIAFRLAKKAQPNDQIIIIGKKERPGSATLAAAAMLNSFAEIEKGSLDSDSGMYHFELSHLATRMWPDFEKEIIETGGSHLPHGCSKCEVLEGGCFDRGTFVINNTAADTLDDENYQAILQALDEFEESYEQVDPKDIPNYKPAERSRATRALLIHDEGWINPRLMMEKLDAVLALFPQVQFLDCQVEKLIANPSGIEAVQLSDQTQLSGDSFLLATGATVSKIINDSELDIRVQPVFYGIGVSLQFRSENAPHKNCIRTPNRGLACGIYSVPFFQQPDIPNDHILIGATNFISPVPHQYSRLINVESLSKAAIEQLNSGFYRAELVRINVGWRPTTQDTYPLLGKTSLNNLFIATGTKRDGFHLSPVISDIMSRMILGESVDERFALFNPERPPLKTMTREQAIEKGSRHLLSAGYQHGFNPAQGRMVDQVREMYRADLEKLHDKVKADDWGIPTEMIEMYRYGHATMYD